VEDQQPGAGALSAEPSADPSPDTAATAAAAAETDDVQPGEPGAEEAAAAEGESGADTSEPGAGQPRRPAGRWLAIAVAAAAAVFVGAAAFAGFAVQPYLMEQARVITKMDVARTAAEAITTLWTYNPDNIEKLPDRAAQYLSGDFEAEYRKYMDKVIPPSKQAQVTNSTQVTGAAVESLKGPNAVALVFTNTTATSPQTKDLPSLKYYSYRLVMKRQGARWLVTKMNTVTSLDLTPQL
jgi:Mce-associated membrane protein